MSFWKNLPKPFFALAPMADVTDPAYRRLIAEYKAPDVTWTEFVSADGLYHMREKAHKPDGENPLMRDLLYTEAERPIVAQLFSSRPEMMSYAANLCKELGFDGVDINMGCPDKSIEKQGCGAAMIKSPEVAKEVIRAAKAAGLPVSVKTRLGYNAEQIDSWIPHLLAEQPAALTVHLRTRKEMSKVPAHWDLMPRIVALRDELSPETLIIGNGDVKDLEDARAKAAASGCDGVMLGRGIFGTPWLFTGRADNDVPPTERIAALQTLATYFGELTPGKSVHILKKHVKAFITGWPEAASLRSRLMETSTLPDFMQVLESASEPTAAVY
ncbi:MAG TPA: tRNA-dihydrouridine synthase [Candidatus Paceibacterota bacterium]|nr:tRNA-dihydrouridine synthase [Candidatus Paceibacterota bacterium]